MFTARLNCLRAIRKQCPRLIILNERREIAQFLWSHLVLYLLLSIWIAIDLYSVN